MFKNTVRRVTVSCWCVTTHQRGPTSTPAPWLWRQRLGAWRPQAGRGLDADNIEQPEPGDAVAKLGVDAIPGVGQHGRGRKAGLQRRVDLGERDLWLGLEGNRVRHASASATDRVVGPGLRQIQPTRNRQAGMVVSERQRDGDLTVVLLAELAAILPGDAHRVRALLGNAGVVDHPAADRAAPLDQRQHAGAHGGKDGIV